MPVGALKIGRIAAERQPHLTNDVLSDPWVGNPAWAKREGMVAFAGYPLVVNDRLVGVMATFATEALPEDTLVALGSVGDAIAQGVERRKAELALEERARDLARSNAELEQFAYVASHDLQEPLRMVASYVQLIERRYNAKLDDNAREFIGFAVEGVTRMRRLIEDLLAYSRVGTRGRAPTPVDVGKIVATAEKNLEQAIAESAAEITKDPLPPEVLADEGQLTQVFQNLIGNAIKFRREDPPRVHVGARREGGDWVFSVRDNGIGIEREYFDRIFVIFQRLNPREIYPGTGHRPRHHQEDRGAPRRTHLGGLDTGRGVDDILHHSRHPAHLENRLMSEGLPIEILLVEDNAADVRLTEEALKEGKVRNHLTVARDGVEALEFLQRAGRALGGEPAGPDPAGPEPAPQGRARGAGDAEGRRVAEAHPGRRPDDVQRGGRHPEELSAARELLHHQAGGPGAVRQRRALHRRVLVDRREIAGRTCLMIATRRASCWSRTTPATRG